MIGRRGAYFLRHASMQDKHVRPSKECARFYRKMEHEASQEEGVHKETTHEEK